MTSSRRIVFLDVDGTLADHTGQMAPTTADAIEQARANGHLVYLCTGRAITDLFAGVRAIPVDGAITNSGAFTEVDGTVVGAHAMPRAQLDELTEYLEANEAIVFLQANTGVYADDRSASAMTSYFAAQGIDVAKLFQFSAIENADLDAIAKVIYFTLRENSAAEVQRAFGESLDIVPASLHLSLGSGGEITPRGINKGSAIEAELARLGLTKADAVGIGDSHNDLDMFRAVGTSVAMGNAVSELKAIADRRTTDLLDDGIRNAFVDLGLIAQ